MRQVTRSAAGVTGPSPPECRPTISRARVRCRALAIGGICGFLAGWFWDTISQMPVVRSELLAALPADVGGSATPVGSVNSQSTSVEALGGADDHAWPGERRAPADDLPVRANHQANRAGEARDSAACGERMRLIEGDYCAVLVHHCVEPFTDGSGRCNRYSTGARCYPPVLSMRFCIDEFEYPNRGGEEPRVMVNFADATRACAAEQKRLCSAREWTLACEGPDRLPYPTGYVRDPTLCNIDLPHRFPDVEALNGSVTAKRELERLNQRVPSGSRPGCVSQYGVYDLVGNVDEWVVPDGPEEAAGRSAKAALKGGYFGPVRARCRPSTPSHGPTFKFYQVGFRCCKDVAADRRGGAVGELAGSAGRISSDEPQLDNRGSEPRDNTLARP